MQPKRDQNILAVLECPRRVWAVSPLDADAGRLAELHAALQPRLAPGDRLVYLGNYLGHGGDTLGTIDELLAFRHRFLTIPGMEPQDIVYLRGAQEEMWWKLLQIQLATIPQEVFDWMMAQGLEPTLRAYGGTPGEARAMFREGVLATTRWTNRLRQQLRARPGHDALLASLYRGAASAGGELLLVHAGVDPNRPLSEQNDTFWWGSGHFDDITAPFSGFRRTVRGFDRARRGVVERDHTVSLDGGADGELIAGAFDLSGRLIDLLRVGGSYHRDLV